MAVEFFRTAAVKELRLGRVVINAPFMHSLKLGSGETVSVLLVPTEMGEYEFVNWQESTKMRDAIKMRVFVDGKARAKKPGKSYRGLRR